LNDFLANENYYKENDNSDAPIPKDYVKLESLFMRDDQAKNIKEEVLV